MERMNYMVTPQLDGSIFISRDDMEQQPYLFRNNTDRCICKEATKYSRQCVHEILLLDRFESFYYDNWWYFRDIVTYWRHWKL